MSRLLDLGLNQQRVGPVVGEAEIHLRRVDGGVHPHPCAHQLVVAHSIVVVPAIDDGIATPEGSAEDGRRDLADAAADLDGQLLAGGDVRLVIPRLGGHFPQVMVEGEGLSWCNDDAIELGCRQSDVVITPGGRPDEVRIPLGHQFDDAQFSRGGSIGVARRDGLHNQGNITIARR